MTGAIWEYAIVGCGGVIAGFFIGMFVRDREEPRCLQRYVRGSEWEWVRH